VKAYKDRPIVSKISVKCHYAFIIPVRFVAVIASRNVFSAMHRRIANACRWIEILITVLSGETWNEISLSN